MRAELASIRYPDEYALGWLDEFLKGTDALTREQILAALRRHRDDLLSIMEHVATQREIDR